MSRPDAELADTADLLIRAERAAELEALGSEGVLWLALVPLWTKSIAEEAGFPASPLIDFVQRARKTDWCKTRGSLRDGGAPDLIFYMPDELRRYALGSGRWDTRVATETARKIASRVTRDETAVPGALQVWAEFMVDLDTADRRLVDQVSEAVTARDLGRVHELIAAGEALAALLAGTELAPTAEQALDRARRLLSLGRRRRMDAADLEHYLDRPELSRAVDRLLEPDTGEWALHLRGVGGVGKTMLIRHLASGQYNIDRGQDPIPVARVDFDYMSPDYPVRRPVQLLLELADELALHTTAVAAADSGLSRFRVTAARVHEEFSGARGAALPAVRDERVLSAVHAFADVLARLPRVLLILDTCEELAKFDAGDPSRPAVTATFEILEHLHSRAPNVRVLFAGRRALPARYDYLRVQLVYGFTIEEARRYLSSFLDTPLSADLRDEIIRQSPGMDGRNRVSPFDLALYHSWAEADPDLTTEQVARGSDAYIEGRIIERLGDDAVVRALPALAMGGRCRVATLSAFLGVPWDSLGPRMAIQEWIDADGDPPAHVAAKPALARRLRRYFRRPDRYETFEAETKRLAALLRDLIQGSSIADTDRDEVLAALRLSAPADAAKLWEDLADRAKDDRDWGWLRDVTDRIRGEWEEEAGREDEEWPTMRALRATVIAAQIAAARRANPSLDTRAEWAEVASSWQAHPDAPKRGELDVRSAAGLLLYQPWDESLWRVLSQGYTSNPELNAAVSELVSGLLEKGHSEAATRVLAQWEFGSPQSAAWAETARARLLADSDPGEARSALVRAGNLILEYGSGATEYFDWIQPDDLLARIFTEWGLIAPPDDDTITGWESYAETHFDTIDADRLASQCLRIRLSRGVIEKSVIERWEIVDGYEPGWKATCSAHDLVPPLFTTLAHAWLAAGEPGRALDILGCYRDAALETRSDEATIRHADTEMLYIARRLRLQDQRRLIERLAYAGNEDARRALAVVLGKMSTELAAQITVAPPDDPLAPMVEANETLPVRHARSADPFPDVRAGIRQSALSGQPYEPPLEMPTRLFAEMAFDEAELLQLWTLQSLFPEAAARAFGLAHDAYGACGDRVGQVLAATALSLILWHRVEADRLKAAGQAGRRKAVAQADRLEAAAEADRLEAAAQADRLEAAALGLLRGAHPDVCLALTGDPNEAGPWRYWASALREVQSLQLSDADSGTLFSKVRRRAVKWFSRFLPEPRVNRADKPFFASFRGRTAFTAYIRGRGHELIDVGPLRKLPAGQLDLLDSGTGSLDFDRNEIYIVQQRFLRRGLVYRGFWNMESGSVVLDWLLDQYPDVAPKLWGPQVKRGVIRAAPQYAELPWERIFSASFGPDAPGCVLWHRRMSVRSKPQENGPINHVIGRAIDTSAGPRFESHADPAGGARRLLGSAEFGTGAPVLIVLQGAPVAEEAEAFAGDDLPEKLALAVDLINAGAAPAVLLVPAVPAILATKVGAAIAVHERKSRKEPRRLQKRLRKILAPTVSAALIDDLVLYMNEGAIRE